MTAQTTDQINTFPSGVTPYGNAPEEFAPYEVFDKLRMCSTFVYPLQRIAVWDNFEETLNFETVLVEGSKISKSDFEQWDDTTRVLWFQPPRFKDDIDEDVDWMTDRRPFGVEVPGAYMPGNDSVRLFQFVGAAVRLIGDHGCSLEGVERFEVVRLDGGEFAPAFE